MYKVYFQHMYLGQPTMQRGGIIGISESGYTGQGREPGAGMGES
jgi:hypothetical protein